MIAYPAKGARSLISRVWSHELASDSCLPHLIAPITVSSRIPGGLRKAQTQGIIYLNINIFDY
jgi:hypothetical protein